MSDVEVTKLPDTRHCMVDLETWGTMSNSIIVAIGAVLFDPTGQMGPDHFHVAIDPRTCEQLGFKPSADTIMWWMDADRDEARARWLSMEKFDLATALSSFSTWYGEESRPTWGNSAAFDLGLLADAYRGIPASGLKVPWKFWDERCYRTLKNLRPDIQLAKANGHDALDDAINQVEHAQRLIAAIGPQA